MEDFGRQLFVILQYAFYLAGFGIGIYFFVKIVAKPFAKKKETDKQAQDTVQKIVGRRPGLGLINLVFGVLLALLGLFIVGAGLLMGVRGSNNVLAFILTAGVSLLFGGPFLLLGSKAIRAGLNLWSGESQEQAAAAAARTADPKARGVCPNCRAEIALISSECPHCKALFGSGSAWKIEPLP